jgi:hypothetical protein
MQRSSNITFHEEQQNKQVGGFEIRTAVAHAGHGGVAGGGLLVGIQTLLPPVIRTILDTWELHVLELGWAESSGPG